MSEYFLKVLEGEDVEQYGLGPEARYVVSWAGNEEIVRVWDGENVWLVPASRLVVMKCRDLGSSRKQR